MTSSGMLQFDVPGQREIRIPAADCQRLFPKEFDAMVRAAANMAEAQKSGNEPAMEQASNIWQQCFTELYRAVVAAGF